MSKNIRRTAMSAFLLFGAIVGQAQVFRASINGSVTDPSGSTIPGASVELRNMATEQVLRATTDAKGSYEFNNLQPGTYELTGQAQGFKTLVRRNLTLDAGTAASQDLVLEVGAVQQSVEVDARAVLLDTESANQKAVLESALLSELPTNTRTPLNFVFAFAGTTEAQGGMTSTSSTTDQMFSMFGLQGGRSGNAQILLDGAPATAPDWGGLMVSPSIESVAEMAVTQNTYDAQYGKSGAGVVSLVTKGGATAFHGSAFDFLQNSALNANSWSNNRGGAPKGQFKRNQFGGSVSGPIWKRQSLFFFAAYEGLRQPSTESSGFLTVPTALERAGDFSQTHNPDGSPMIIYNPFTTREVTDASGNKVITRDPFQGNRIPSNMIDPAAQKIAALWPLPNRQGEGANLINNYYAQGRGNTTNDRVDWRVDWAHSDKNRIFVRTSQRIRQNYDPACYYCNGADPSTRQFNPGFQVTVNDVWTPSANWVVSALIGGSRWQEGQTSLAYPTMDASDIGLNPAWFQAPVPPGIGTDYAGLFNSTYRRLTRYAHTAQLNVTKQQSSHTLKFGANFDLSLMNNLDEDSRSLNFGRGITSCDPGSNSLGLCEAQQGSTISGNSLASLLLGVGGGEVQVRPDKAMSLHTYGAYFQDDWRMTRRLTVNLGLRYENQRPVTERYNRLARFDLHALSPISSAVAGQLGRPVYGGFEFANGNDRFGWPSDNKNFAPRVGLAYQVSNKLVARSGFGMFYLPTSAMISYDDPGQFVGFSSATNWSSTVNNAGYVPSNLLSNAFPNGTNQPVGSSQGLMTFVGQSAGQSWPLAPHPTGYTIHFSAGVQYQLTNTAVIEAGYTGWRGRKMMYGEPMPANQMPTEYLSLGSKLDEDVPNPFFGVITDPNSPLSGETVKYNQLLRPFPQFADVNWSRSLPGARATFNALNLKFTYRFNAGLSLLSTYQYSKTMDNGSEDYIGWIMGSSWRDAYNTRLDYSISAHDMPHSWVTALLYAVPFGKGQKYGGSLPPVANQILGGWQVSSIVRLNSGLPMFPIMVNTWFNPLSLYGFPGNPRPNLVGNPVPDNQTTEQWVNSAAFETPAAYTYGNAPRYIDGLRESPTRNVDLTLAKNFKAEAFNIQFRADFLNLFNTPQFGGGNQWGSNISNCIECGDLGTVYGTRNAPRNIQLGLKVQFDD